MIHEHRAMIPEPHYIVQLGRARLTQWVLYCALGTLVNWSTSGMGIMGRPLLGGVATVRCTATEGGSMLKSPASCSNPGLDQDRTPERRRPP